jgi:RHS repeat-associated protein
LTQEQITDSVNGNYSASYQYDNVGNRLQSSVKGVTTSYTYDENDRLIQQGSTVYSYDANGNTLSKNAAGQVSQYTYNNQDKLVAVQQGADSIFYQYNSDGIRTQKTQNGVATKFIVDENRNYAQVLVEDNPLQRVVYSYGDDLISQNRNGAWAFYHYDGLGSTRRLSNAAGVVTDAYDYEAFAETLNKTGSTANAYLFTGEQFDGSLNQYYLRARYYDQGSGRFTQMDSYQGNNADPVTLHKYVYTNSNPINGVDPSGYMTLMDLVEAMDGIEIQGASRAVASGQLRRAVKNIIEATVKDFVSARNVIRNCLKKSKKSCDIDIPILIVGGDNPEMADHIMGAQTKAAWSDEEATNWVPAGFFHSFSKRKKQKIKGVDWYIGKNGCTATDKENAVKKYGPKVDCDEFPMNAMDLGGPEHYPAFVSLRYVPGGQNKSIGAMWGQLADHSGMKSNLNKKALVVAWKEIPMSVWIPDK